jgi:hypothetical protein
MSANSCILWLHSSSSIIPLKLRVSALTNGTRRSGTEAHLLNDEKRVLPFVEIIAESVASSFPGAGKRRAHNNERSFSADVDLQCFVRVILLHHSSHVLNIELGVLTSIRCIGCKHIDRQTANGCVSYVSWVVYFASK